MISMDMKYTALYWALRFVENELDVHVKEYSGYKITIYANEQEVDFGDKIICEQIVGGKTIQQFGKYPLNSHKSFVVLELIDRLLNNGYKPESIKVFVDSSIVDVVLDTGNCYAIIHCLAWGDYVGGLELVDADYELTYTSRLVSGLLEYKGVYYTDGWESLVGVGSNASNIDIEASSDFEIVGDELITYKGKSKLVKVPEGITTIGASAFWNNTFVEEVVLPKSLKRIGGDCFYYCTNLKKVNIPSEVWIMGNNPFAGCPKLELTNESPYFVVEDGILYGRDKKDIIYYPINKKIKEYIVPNTVTCIGKHCFFNCDNLERIVIHKNVVRFENNPFSGCTKLEVENHSPYYHFENGVIYNKFKTTIIGCLNGSQIDELRIPETVTSINRNAFWNCKGIKKVVITKNIVRIGYNPFASAENMYLESESPEIVSRNGILYDKTMTNLLCATNRAVGKSYYVPDSVKIINRGVFSGCKDLEQIDFNAVTYIDKSSFTNCTSLKEVYIPDSVTYVGEWVFSYCKNLKTISINKNTFVDKNAFNECPAEIIWRD